MLSFKNKLEIIKSINSPDFNLSKIDTYIEYMKHNALVPSVLQRIVDALIDIDVNISAIHESISEEDWNDIASSYDTPIEKPLYGAIRDKIRTFVNTYIEIDKIVKDIKINTLFECFEKICLIKTNSIQFLFFRLGTLRPKAVLYFFLHNLEKNPNVYVPYFSSFVVRADVDTDEAIHKYIEYVRNLKRGIGTSYVLSAQGLMYVCCFKKNYIEYCKDIIENVFAEGICSHMNPNVVNKFCSLFDFKSKYFKNNDHFSLYYFPFDRSTLDEIHELYEDRYILFK